MTRLEKNGYVVRLKPSNDHRRVYLKLTAEGEALYDSLGEEVDRCYDRIETVFSKEKMRQLQNLLGELSNIGNLLK